jgi:pyridoxine/pyridoxamine 5'-phosphate oxidase
MKKPAVTRRDIFEFIRAHKMAVQASVAATGEPQAAAIGIAVTEGLEIVFDTLATSRKARNLRQDPRIALVIGWDLDDERTVQYEGVVDEPAGAELERLKAVYFATYPDGPERERWPDITYFRARPTWIRYSDYSGDEPVIVAFD